MSILANTLLSSLRHPITRIFCTIMLLCPLSTFALNISLIYNPESSYQTSFLHALSERLTNSDHIQLKTIPSTELSSVSLSTPSIDALVNLDSDSIGKILTLGLQRPTFHAMTTLANARRYAACLPNCLNSLAQHRFFVLDQPAARQLDLIQLISPAFNNIGVIVTDYSLPHFTGLKKLAAIRQQTVIQHLTSSASLRYKINHISKTSDIILAVADTRIYNASSLPQILLTSYRHKTPVIGFSKGFIKAGAIAGTVSNLQQLTQQLSERLLVHDSAVEYEDGNLVYPKYFDVLTNRHVAKSLNLHFPSDDELKKQLLSHEGLQ
ncbi:MAG: ABC transporter substrate binding protein [Cycloclasticus sp.]